MNKSRSLISAVLTATLAAAGLSACSSGSDDGGVVTLNWWARIGDGQKELAEAFNATHDDIKIKLTQLPDDQYVNKVGTGVRSSNGPDVLDFDVANAPLFAANGVLADISSRVDSLPYKDSLNPGMAKVAAYDGKTYSVPFNAGPSFVLYNKTLFKKAGLDPNKPPKTWADIKNAATKVRALGKDIYGFDIPGACGGALSYTVQPFIWASGGTTMTEANSEQTTTYASSPQVAKTFGLYRDMWKAGVVSPRAETTDCATWGQEWQAGKVGMIVAGAWMVAPAEKSGAEVGYFPIFGENGGESTFAGGNNAGITTSSDNQDAAWTFVSWLLDKEQQLTMSKANGQAPVRSDINVEDTPLVALQQQVGEKSNAPDSIAANALQLSATSPWLSAFQQIVFQGKDTEKALKQADSASKDLIEQAYQQVGR
ncbi:ABC transporter substrate-binding protein [Streptomyces rubrogriseus]|uniref:ABC transporter substrate-binding protein n=1 Tax=Streptomyces rubrogriseus TaxID=194673 RepID=UPI0036FBBE58